MTLPKRGCGIRGKIKNDVRFEKFKSFGLVSSANDRPELYFMTPYGSDLRSSIRMLTTRFRITLHFDHFCDPKSNSLLRT